MFFKFIPFRAIWNHCTVAFYMAFPPWRQAAAATECYSNHLHFPCHSCFAIFPLFLSLTVTVSLSASLSRICFSLFFSQVACSVFICQNIFGSRLCRLRLFWPPSVYNKFQLQIAKCLQWAQSSHCCLAFFPFPSMSSTSSTFSIC